MAEDAYERNKAEAYKLLTDLDRCEHGRHEGDACFGCPDGISPGNPYLPPGAILGYDIGGQLYAMPARGQRHDRRAWLEAGKGTAVEPSNG